MKILIVTVGTRSDVQPYVALGRALKTSGNDVTICTHAYFEFFIRGNGTANVVEFITQWMNSQ